MTSLECRGTLRPGGRYRVEDFRDTWPQVPRLLRSRMSPLTPPWEDASVPLRAGNIDDLSVVGQICQSTDGRVGTTTGRSDCINGAAGIPHLHRLRDPGRVWATHATHR